MTQTIWDSLVAETQFATELAVAGLRRLCSVPTEPGLFMWDTTDLNYALHVGMHSYSSGLERLCKLAIACNVYAATGTFPNLRKYSHKIGNLLDAVGALIPPGHDTSMHKAKYLVRPFDALDPDLTNMVERFANGAGRYEHLDSLWNLDAEVNTYNEWSALAPRSSVSDKVRELISIKKAMSEAIRSELVDRGLESTGSMSMEDLEHPTYIPSVGVALSLFRKVRWASTVLDTATYYTRQELPLLGEVVAPAFCHSSSDFFNYHIARIGDEVVIVEELQEVLKRIRTREVEEGTGDINELSLE